MLGANTEFLESKIRSGEWDELARYAIMDGGAGVAFDIHYFYLGLAADGLGLAGPSETYFRRSISTSRQVSPCASEAISGTKFPTLCGSFPMPQAGLNALATIERRAERLAAQERERQRVEAEQEAREEQAARAIAEQKRLAEEAQAQRNAQQRAYLEGLRNRFPENQVQAILAHKPMEGMSRAAIREALGEPRRRDMIGDRERWDYSAHTNEVDQLDRYAVIRKPTN